jgi:NADH:ubiquinone oxidoreductase subunit 6 (subunit J)
MPLTVKLFFGVVFSCIGLVVAALSHSAEVFASRDRLVGAHSYVIIWASVAISYTIIIDFISRATNKKDNSQILGHYIATIMSALVSLALLFLAVGVYIYNKKDDALNAILGTYKSDVIIASYCTVLLLCLSYSLKIDWHRANKV